MKLSAFRISRRSNGVFGALVGGALALIVALNPTEAQAQRLKLAGQLEVGSGIIGGARKPANGIQRARTTLRLAGEGFVDESPENLFSVGLDVEIEPKSAFGVDVRYARLIGKRFSVNAGGQLFIAPKTLLGPVAGFQYRQPIGKRFVLLLGPQVQVFFLGSDLPKGNILVQGLFNVGAHVQF